MHKSRSRISQRNFLDDFLPFSYTNNANVENELNLNEILLKISENLEET